MVERLWPRAALRRDEDFELERKVTWLELFFDLVFVVVLARMAHGFAHHPDWSGFVDFALLFAAMFWAWNAFTYYIERFESGGLEHRLSMLAAMVAVAATAVWVEDGLGENYVGFAIGFAATRAINMTQWIRAGRHVPEFAPVAARFVAGFATSMTLVVVAGQLDRSERLIVFGIAVLVDILSPITTLRLQQRLPALSTSKFPERFGLFTIIVLGESVVGVVNGLSARNEEGHLVVGDLVVGGLGMLIGIGLWWLYFDFVARRAPKPRIGVALAWAYLHMATLAAITTVGAMLSVVVSGDDHKDAAQLILMIAVGLSILGIGLTESTLDRRGGEPTNPTLSPRMKIGFGLAIVGIAPVVDSSPTAVGLSIASAALAACAIYGVCVWYAASNEHRNEVSLPAPQALRKDS